MNIRIQHQSMDKHLDIEHTCTLPVRSLLLSLNLSLSSFWNTRYIGLSTRWNLSLQSQKFLGLWTYTHAPLYLGLWTHWHLGLWTHWHLSLKHIGILVCEHIGILVCEHIGILVCEHIGILVCEHMGILAVELAQL